MLEIKNLAVLSSLASVALALPSSSSSSLPVKLETRSELNSRLANVHVTHEAPIEGSITYTYGSCSSDDFSDAHHVVSRGAGFENESRLVWVQPEEMPTSEGCLSAWDSEGTLIGRSEPQRLQRRNGNLGKRGDFSIPMTNATGINAWGPWFDGVELLESKNMSGFQVHEAKSKEVAIVGAGMSGLMTYLVLHQAGMKNIKILEAAQRLGGRVHTSYLSGGPFDYSYQEMGPMRFPYQVEYSNKTYNVTDHQMVFQLADEMNKLNNHDANFSVDFIPWIQENENGLYYFNGVKLDTGLPPTLAQVAANASLSADLPMNPSTQKLSNKVNAAVYNESVLIDIAQNTFQAHSDFIESGLGGLGGDTWSEFAYMVNYLNATLNDTDVVGASDSSFWGALYDSVYFSAATWKTIDGGLSRLPESFHPLVDNVTTMNTNIERVEFLPDSQKVKLQWRRDADADADNFTTTTTTTAAAGNSQFHDEVVDYAVFALPFSKVKRMRLPHLPTTISNAIDEMPFEAACKVALEYRTRFWEGQTDPSSPFAANPIFGGCSTTTDIPGIGSICYPSYCSTNGSCADRPATMLASYISGDWGSRAWLSVSEEEHVRYMVDAMAEIHGAEAAEQWTGKYDRRCWALDPYEGGSWASPTVGMHQLYLPEYFRTYDHMIFVGEQTSYTHAWIASALESGIRGGVQLLLELGLVDEAKFTVEKWMARWIDV